MLWNEKIKSHYGFKNITFKNINSMPSQQLQKGELVITNKHLMVKLLSLLFTIVKLPFYYCNRQTLPLWFCNPFYPKRWDRMNQRNNFSLPNIPQFSLKIYLNIFSDGKQFSFRKIILLPDILVSRACNKIQINSCFFHFLGN